MAIQSITQLKEWFRTGCYPTEAQFHDWLDSFRHKRESLSIMDIAELSNVLNKLYTRKEAEALQVRFNDVLERLRQLDGELENQLAAIGYSKENFAEILGLVEKYEVLKRDIDNIDDYIIPHEIEPKIDYNRELIDAIRSRVGARATVNEQGTETPGIAPLDTAGKIAARYLPSFVDDAMDFGGFAPDEVEFAGTKYTGDMQGTDPQVLFSRKEGVFILHVTPVSSTGRPQSPVYYPDWELLPEHELCLGAALAGGRLPLKTKTYYDPVTNKSYRWTGASLAPTGSDIDLGDEAGTAFPGDRGRMVESFVNRLGPLIGPELMKDNTTLSRFITDVLEGLGLDEIAASYAPDMARKADRTELSTVLAGDVISEVTAPQVMQFTRQELMWDLFDRMWAAAGGIPIVPGVRYGLNGLDDITAPEALKIWRASIKRGQSLWQETYGTASGGIVSFCKPQYLCRTYFPLMVWEDGLRELRRTFKHNTSVEAVRIMGNYPGGVITASLNATFQGCRALKEVRFGPDGYGRCVVTSDNNAFSDCVNLRFAGLRISSGVTVDLSASPVLTPECVAFIVTNSDGGTVTVHPDTFGRLTDELLEAASAKNITITTP